MKTFCISYRMLGDEYHEEIKAESLEDAQRRLLAIQGSGVLEGELMAAIPVPSFFGRFFKRK